jgi:hypothetical protein
MLLLFGVQRLPLNVPLRRVPHNRRQKGQRADPLDDSQPRAACDRGQDAADGVGGG